MTTIIMTTIMTHDPDADDDVGLIFILLKLIWRQDSLTVQSFPYFHVLWNVLSFSFHSQANVFILLYSVIWLSVDSFFRQATSQSKGQEGNRLSNYLLQLYHQTLKTKGDFHFTTNKRQKSWPQKTPFDYSSFLSSFLLG